MDNDDPKAYSIKEQLILMLPNSTVVNRKEIFYWWDNISSNHIKYPSVKWDLFIYSSNVLLICFFCIFAFKDSHSNLFDSIQNNRAKRMSAQILVARSYTAGNELIFNWFKSTSYIIQTRKAKVRIYIIQETNVIIYISDFLLWFYVVFNCLK